MWKQFERGFARVRLIRDKAFAPGRRRDDLIGQGQAKGDALGLYDDSGRISCVGAASTTSRPRAATIRRIGIRGIQTGMG